MNNAELAKVKEESREFSHMKTSRLDDSLFSKELAPHYMKLAGQLSASEMVPKCFRNKPADLFLSWALGYQIGMSPEQSMQCIAVINGRAAMWGDDMLALCMTHKDFVDIIEEPILGKDNSIIGYTCTVKRKGMTDKTNTFTLEDAKKAGLLAKGGVWTQYPSRMLKLRARGFSLRDAFPDALKGINPREEVEDYIDGEYTVEDSKGSRTELLKKDYMAKTAKPSNEDLVYGVAVNEEHAVEVVPVVNFHDEIMNIIIERQMPDEELTKELSYYEVASVKDLTLECAEHFYNRLNK